MGFGWLGHGTGMSPLVEVDSWHSQGSAQAREDPESATSQSTGRRAGRYGAAMRMLWCGRRSSWMDVVGPKQFGLGLGRQRLLAGAGCV